MQPERLADHADASPAGRHLVRAAGSLDGVPADPSRPWTWSAPLMALGRTPVRMHGSFMALALLQTLRVIRPGPSGPLPPTMAQMLVVLVTLAWLALLADAVREWASRRSGGAAGAIVIWPAGGLSWRDVPGPWSSRAAIALSVPVTTACVSLALALTLTLHGCPWNVALPSPWTLDGVQTLSGDRWWSTLWLVQWTNIAMLAATLIPAHPFAGGRIVESVLEPWLGREGAVRASVVLGIAIGITLTIAGLAFGSLIASVCGATAVAVGMSGGRTLGLRPGMVGIGLWTMIASDLSATSRARAAARAARQAREDDAALDPILDKVARQGIASLTRDERDVLSRSTARRKTGEANGGAASNPSRDGTRSRHDADDSAAS